MKPRFMVGLPMELGESASVPSSELNWPKVVNGGSKEMRTMAEGSPKSRNSNWILAQASHFFTYF